jgi:hypothetical protein
MTNKNIKKSLEKLIEKIPITETVSLAVGTTISYYGINQVINKDLDLFQAIALMTFSLIFFAHSYSSFQARNDYIRHRDNPNLEESDVQKALRTPMYWL